MKPHLLITLSQDVVAPLRPHWQDLLVKSSLAERVNDLLPSIDFALNAHDISVWATCEYSSSQKTWTSEELRSGLHRIYRLVLQRNQVIPESLINAIALLPEVKSVRIGAVGQSVLPEPLFQTASIRTNRHSREMIQLSAAHQITQGLPEIKIAVLDTGIQVAHPELVDAMLPGYDFVDILNGANRFLGDYLGADPDPDDEVGHGTHVAGIIAAQGKAIPIGVAPKCRLIPVRVLGAMRQGKHRVGAGLVDNINNGIKWAIDQGAHIINMSLGIQHSGGGLPHEEVIRYAQAKGIIIVAAAGNDGQENRYYPGALPGVIAVGALDAQGKIASFSTYGRQVVIAAPGTEIYSTYINNSYAFSSGTSQAAPFVSGAIALLQSRALAISGRYLTNAQINHVLKHTADKLNRHFRHSRAGFGALNLKDALRLLDHRLQSYMTG